MSPSKALQRDFVLQDSPAEPAKPLAGDSALSAHGFILGGVGLLLPRGTINEIIEKRSVCELPNTPSWFSGIISLRGSMVPVFDLSELISAAADTNKSALLAIGQGEDAVAVWIDDLPAWKTFNKEDGLTSIPPLPNLLREHVVSSYARDGQIWVDWNVTEFFSSLSRRI